MKSRYLPFYLIAIAVFIGIAGPALFSDGMFVDGLVYSSIARNLADGLGSFWDLHYTETLYPHFFEHPPLAFGFQSLFFRILGDGIYTERIYSLLTFFVTGWIITSIWKEVILTEYKKYAWFPLAIWVTIPLVTWAPACNLLENTMMIFTSLSVLFFLKSRQIRRVLYLALSGIMLFLGFMTKGPVALFPLALPFWICIVRNDYRFKQFFVDMLILGAGLLIPFLSMYVLIPESADYLKAYYNNQILRSMDVATVNTRLFIVFRLLKELIPAAGIVLLTYLLTLRQKSSKNISTWYIVFFALGLSGVLPIIISTKQSGFYILATLPFFSIAIATLIVHRLSVLVSKIKFLGMGYRIFKIASVVLVIAAIAISSTQVNKIGRDKNKLQDVYSLSELLPEHSTISIQKSLWTDWSLHGYLQRYGKISIDSNPEHSYKYMLIKKGYTGENVAMWKFVSIDLNLYDLYEKDPAN